MALINYVNLKMLCSSQAVSHNYQRDKTALGDIQLHFIFLTKFLIKHPFQPNLSWLHGPFIPWWDSNVNSLRPKWIKSKDGEVVYIIKEEKEGRGENIESDNTNVPQQWKIVFILLLWQCFLIARGDKAPERMYYFLQTKGQGI